jgi:putative toxin-antitoxin system antitoxin component (TIGR02293 family)
MVRIGHIVEVLGGWKILKRSVSTQDQLREAVRAGLPYASLVAVMGELGLARTEAADAIHLPPRTVARRKKEQKLQADESDRLVRLARLAAQGADALGDKEKAATWLRRPNRALGGKIPLELLDSDIGVRQVEEVLGRIEHGVYS